MTRSFVAAALGLAAAVALHLTAHAQPQDRLAKEVAKIKVDSLAKVEAALPDKAPAAPKQPRNILVFSNTGGFRHGSIAIGGRAITLMGDKTKAYTAFATEDESFFEPAKLARFDAVFFLNTTNDCLRPRTGNKEEDARRRAEFDKREEELKKSLVDFVASGKGLIGVHAATDTYQRWPEFNKMMGGAFDGHPWNANGKVGVKNLDPTHPVNASFNGAGFEITDEIYQFRADTAVKGERRYLLALDGEKTNLKIGKRADGFYPISWVATYGKGRNFYCSLGHNDSVYWNPAVLRHYLAGIQYALGDLEVNATPQAARK